MRPAGGVLHCIASSFYGLIILRQKSCSSQNADFATVDGNAEGMVGASLCNRQPSWKVSFTGWTPMHVLLTYEAQLVK